MIFESWSIALITCSAITVVLGFVGSLSALRVIRFWDAGSDSERQIDLEERVWLTATLTQFALVVQIVSALIFIYAAGYFATVLKGAMCAAGALTANWYGLPALTIKIITIFLAALWIIVHRLDIGCEDYPLTRFKSIWLLVLLPFICSDAFLTISYLLNLDPEIITSCCGVLFSSSDGGGYSLFDHATPSRLVWLSALSGGIAAGCSLLLRRISSADRKTAVGWAAAVVACTSILSWVGFYLLAILVVTVIVSPYVYALPHHRCPFDLLHYPYAAVGLPLYLFLHVAVLFGLGGAVAGLNAGRRIPADAVQPFMKIAVLLSISGLFLFIVTAAWPPLSYVFFGGQK